MWKESEMVGDTRRFVRHVLLCAIILVVASEGVVVRKTLAIASLRDLKRGGIMRDVDSVYSMGFNDVFVPIQKTNDMKPRFLVSNNEKISRSTMMEYHRNQTAESSYVPLLGEFFSETSTMIDRLWIPVTDPEDVDVIVHNMALSARSANCFSMVVSSSVVSSMDGKNDAMTRYRGLVHDGKIMMIAEGDIIRSLHLARDSHVHMVAFPSVILDEESVRTAREMSVMIGASNADSKTEIQRMISLGVDFFITKSPFQYMSATSTKKANKRVKVHAAVMFG